MITLSIAKITEVRVDIDWIAAPSLIQKHSREGGAISQVAVTAKPQWNHDPKKHCAATIGVLPCVYTFNQLYAVNARNKHSTIPPRFRHSMFPTNPSLPFKHFVYERYESIFLLRSSLCSISRSISYDTLSPPCAISISFIPKYRVSLHTTSSLQFQLCPTRYNVYHLLVACPAAGERQRPDVSFTEK